MIGVTNPNDPLESWKARSGESADSSADQTPAQPGFAAAEPGSSEEGDEYPEVQAGSGRGRLIVIVIIALVAVLVLCVLGAFLVNRGDDDDKKATPSPSRTSAAPTTQSTVGNNLAPFENATLRAFAERGALRASTCARNTSQLTGSSQAVQCVFPNGYTVLYILYTSREAREAYAVGASQGFGGAISVRTNGSWSRGGQTQGRFVAGTRSSNNSQYIYWDSTNSSVSGEVFANTTDTAAVENFFSQTL
jgi:hypothetical protein